MPASFFTIKHKVLFLNMELNLVQIAVKRTCALKFFLTISLQVSTVRFVRRQNLLGLRCQNSSTAVEATDGRGEHFATKDRVRCTDNPPGFGIGHPHGGRSRAQRMMFPHPVQQGGNSWTKAALIIIAV